MSWDISLSVPDSPLTMTQTIDKKTLAGLIDAYADAKASKNQYLVNTMVAQLEAALDSLFAPTQEVEDPTNES